MGTFGWDIVEFVTPKHMLIAMFSFTALNLLLGKGIWPLLHHHGFPRVGYPWWLSLLPSKPVHDLFEEGYQKVGTLKLPWLSMMQSLTVNQRDQVTKPSDKPFIMYWWAMDYVFLPSKYLVDVTRASWENVSFFQNLSDVRSGYAVPDRLALTCYRLSIFTHLLEIYTKHQTG